MEVNLDLSRFTLRDPYPTSRRLLVIHLLPSRLITAARWQLLSTSLKVVDFGTQVLSCSSPVSRCRFDSASHHSSR